MGSVRRLPGKAGNIDIQRRSGRLRRFSLLHFHTGPLVGFPVRGGKARMFVKIAHSSITRPHMREAATKCKVYFH